MRRAGDYLRRDGVAVGIVAVDLAGQFAVVQDAKARVPGIRRVVIHIYRNGGDIARSEPIRPGVGETVGADIVRVRCIGECTLQGRDKVPWTSKPIA